MRAQAPLGYLVGLMIVQSSVRAGRLPSSRLAGEQEALKDRERREAAKMDMQLVVAEEVRLVAIALVANFLQLISCNQSSVMLCALPSKTWLSACLWQQRAVHACFAGHRTARLLLP